MQGNSIAKNDTFCSDPVMKSKKLILEHELALVAKDCREKAGLSKAEAGRQLGVGRATVHQAEECPEVSLTKFRIKMIETFGTLKVSGPFFQLQSP